MARVRYSAVLPTLIFVVWSPGRPVILVPEHCDMSRLRNKVAQTFESPCRGTPLAIGTSIHMFQSITVHLAMPPYRCLVARARWEPVSLDRCSNTPVALCFSECCNLSLAQPGPITATGLCKEGASHFVLVSSGHRAILSLIIGGITRNWI